MACWPSGGLDRAAEGAATGGLDGGSAACNGGLAPVGFPVASPRARAALRGGPQAGWKGLERGAAHLAILPEASQKGRYTVLLAESTGDPHWFSSTVIQSVRWASTISSASRCSAVRARASPIRNSSDSFESRCMHQSRTWVSWSVRSRVAGLVGSIRL